MRKLFIVVTLFFLLGNIQSGAQVLTSAEYFWNTDPGVGNGTAVTVTPADSISVNFSFSINSLSTGSHVLGFRSRDVNGRWSHTEFRSFFIINQPAVPAVQRYEYFFNQDPGVGNATVLSLPAADSVSLMNAIDISALSAGHHVLGLRFADAGGRWSHTEFRSFYKSPANSSNNTLVAAELFIGSTDPGLGNAIPFTINPAGDSVTINRDSVLNNLPLGTYRVNLRFRNADGVWSHAESRRLTICSTYGAQSEMTFQIEGNQVFFTNQSLYYDTISWRFGDGSFDTVTNPIKTYSTANIYNVLLITGNSCAIDTLITPIEIRGLQRINATSAGNGGLATITFNGFGFNTNTNVSLVKNGQPIVPIRKFFRSSAQIIATFNMNALDTGRYDAVANLNSTFDTLRRALLVEPATDPNVTLSITGRNPVRVGRMRQFFNFQNTGNQNAYLVPFATQIGYVPGNPVLDPQFFPQTDIVFLNNKGVFQQTYAYLNANNIATDVMSESDVDTSRKKKLIAYYRLSTPAKTLITDPVRIINQTSISYSIAALTRPPLFNANFTAGDISSPARDCMNSFLKRAVQKHLNVTINQAVWDTSFNRAFDTLSRTLRDMATNLEINYQVVPAKALFSSLLVHIAQAGGSGLPAVIPAPSFRKVVQRVTRNWLLLEDLDSIAQPCFSAPLTEFNQQKRNEVRPSGKISAGARTANDNCPGAQFAPELAAECETFTRFSDAAETLGGKVAENFFAVNSATAFCKELCELASIDPNIKVGPGNNSTEKYVNHRQNAAYTIFFENLPTATAPAAYAEIRDTLDKAVFDLSSFQTGLMGWGDSLHFVEANRTNLSVLRDLRPARPNLLRIDVTLDTASGVALWKFWTLDTITRQLTESPFEGFLPPNTDGQSGVGFVSFNIRPKNSVGSGTILRNKATIIFDENAPLTTPVWEYRIDTTRPQSSVAPLPSVTTTTRFAVRWNGTDVHSGISRYGIFVSVNDSAYKVWRLSTPATVDTFQGVFGKRYKFYSVAVDRAGNYERPPTNPLANPDAVTTLEIPTNVPDLQPQNIKVFPRFTKGMVMVQSNQRLQVQVVSQSGVVLQTVWLNGNGSLDLTPYPSGMYILKILPSNETIKIMKH